MLSVAEAGAQSITSSPYSRYGLGDITSPGTGHNIAMGGTSIAESTPLYVNTVNPACLTNLQLQRFVFDVGFDVRYTNTKSSIQSQKNCNTTFKYLAGAFAAKPWWYFSFMLKPYSSMGYKAMDTTSGYTETFEGQGGLNKVAISTAFKFFKMFSVGFTGNVIFGNMERSQQILSTRYDYIINNSHYPFTSSYYMNDKRIMHGVQGDIGLRFEKSFKSTKDSLRNALRISAGLYLSNKANITAREERFIRSHYSYYSQYYSGVTYYSARTDTLANDTISTAKITLPRGIGVGISMEIAEKLTINADYYTQQWGNFKLPDDVTPSNTRDSKYMGVGLQFAEAKYSSKYYRTIIYRIGAHRQETHLNIGGHGIDEKGVTFGLGFPIRSLLLNISCDLGKRGTTEHNLHEEKYFLMHFSATLHDVWFVKRKFQ